METIIRFVKQWDEVYYVDESNGMHYYSPGKKEGLTMRKHSITMSECLGRYTAYLTDEYGGAIISGDTEDECAEKFHEAYLMMLFVHGLLVTSGMYDK